MQDLYYVLFQNQGKLEHLKNLLGTLIHSVYNQHNLLYVELMQFAQLCTRPKVPFQAHQLGKRARIVYTRYMCRKSLQSVT